jgi:hypothetical protein
MFAFHESETVGPRMLARLLKDAAISPRDLLKIL